MSRNNGRGQEKALFYYRRLARVREFVCCNYTQEITLRQAAEVAAMETTYFATFFREKVGISFFDWLRRFRVERANELLLKNELSVAEVAFEVGFGSIRTFERVFKTFTGMTPSAAKRSAHHRSEKSPPKTARRAV